MAVRFGQATLESWSEPVVDESKVNKKYGRRKRQPIMFPTTHDITRRNYHHCATVLEKLLAAGNRVLIVSKPDVWCIKLLCQLLQPYRDQVMFRFSVGTLSLPVSLTWEDSAPSPYQRLHAAGEADGEGFRVSFSAEPFLGDPRARSDAVAAHHLYQAVAGHSAGPIWFGPMNKIAQRVHGVPQTEVERLVQLGQPETLREIYEELKDRPRVRFKDGFTKVIDMPPQTDDWPDLPEVDDA
jgi:hypothetical protein